MKRLPLLLSFGLLAACGGGGSGGDSATQGSGAAAPTVSFSASPTSVASGGTSTLTWTASNATSCAASGAWSGNQATSGSFQTGALSADATFTLNCSGAGGGVVSRVTVSVTPQNANSPSVQLTASPPGVALNGSTTLTWSTSNVSSCTASGAWSGTQPTSGSAPVGPLTQDQTYQLSCSGANGNAIAMTTVTIRRAELSWTAPTQNVDGSALTNLAGYKVFWGNQSRSYGSPAIVNSPSTTTYALDLGPGTYFFALKAFDSTGTESAYTNEVSKTIY